MVVAVVLPVAPPVLVLILFGVAAAAVALEQQVAQAAPHLLVVLVALGVQALAQMVQMEHSREAAAVEQPTQLLVLVAQAKSSSLSSRPKELKNGYLCCDLICN